MAFTKPLAINPLPWTMASGWGSPTEAGVREALADLSGTEYGALHTHVPDDMNPQAYRDLLAQHGFEPAPGYFAADFTDAQALPEVTRQAVAHARQLASLGVDTTFVGAMISMTRMTRPAVGHGFDAEVTKRTAEHLALVAEAVLREGVRFALHPHVAMTVETEQETRMILDQTAGSALAFGPDTGHLFWVGTPPQHLIRDYADRVAAVHLKDVDLAALQRATRFNDDFMTAVNTRHVWSEPGRGAVNFPDVLAALPQDFDGWLVVEVDVPNLPDRLQSSRASADYITGLLNKTEVAA